MLFLGTWYVVIQILKPLDHSTFTIQLKPPYNCPEVMLFLGFTIEKYKIEDLNPPHESPQKKKTEEKDEKEKR